MNAILKYHLRQLINYWHNLKFRIRVETIILFIIFFTFFTNKFILYFNQLLSLQEASPIGLNIFILHLLALVVIVSTPYIYFNLFPKQNGLTNLSLYPLAKSDVLTLLMIYFTKYQILIIIIATPILTALTISTGPLMLLYILVFAGSALFLPSIMILILASKYQSRLKIFYYYFLFFLFYFISFAVLYRLTEFYFYFNCLVIFGGWIILLKTWNGRWHSWDHMLNRLHPVILKSTQSKSKLTYFKFSSFIPLTIRPLFVKELLSHIRNKNYIRLKIISFLVYVIILILIDIFYQEYYASAISFLTILLIWEHYSHQFNEKYVTKESQLFIKVLPIKFYQYGLSKFFSEFLYIILILGVVLIMTLIHGISTDKIINVIGIITLFSVFVLYIITLIRIIFYDNPRTAGYAYHFLIIFTVVMNFQFYLVGPIITFFIIFYLHYKSYRQFVR